MSPFDLSYHRSLPFSAGMTRFIASIATSIMESSGSLVVKFCIHIPGRARKLVTGIDLEKSLISSLADYVCLEAGLLFHHRQRHLYRHAVFLAQIKQAVLQGVFQRHVIVDRLVHNRLIQSHRDGKIHNALWLLGCCLLGCCWTCRET